MCGQYVSPTQPEMERYWELANAQKSNSLAQQFNVFPAATVPMIYRTAGRLEVVAARWGFIPVWWKAAKPPSKAFNARSEESATKPMWRYPAGKARCLVPAMGWYEWKEFERIDPSTGEVKKAKQYYLIQRADRQPIAFAGFMSRRTTDDHRLELTCTILTRDAAGRPAEIHTRMPIALPKDVEAAWLDPELTDPAAMVGFARDNSITEFMLHPVNPRVNNARNEDADLMQPFENPA
jgi:putative SOS response-associated peptidase YedK